MDPDKVLADLTQWMENFAERVSAAPSEDGQHTIDDDAIYYVLDAWRALDQWMSRGGFPPKRWAPRGEHGVPVVNPPMLASEATTPVVSMADIPSRSAFICECTDDCTAVGEDLGDDVFLAPGHGGRDAVADVESMERRGRVIAARTNEPGTRRVVNPAPVVVPKEWIRRIHDELRADPDYKGD